MRKRCVTGILTVFLLNSAASRASAQMEFEGQPVVDIAFDPVRQPLDAAELSGLVPVGLNKPYHAADVRMAIEKLYATGRYQDIQVDAEKAAGGISLRFITKNNWFIGGIAAKEDFSEPPSRGQIVSASRLQLGDLFDLAAIPAAIANIRKVLVDNGYYNPGIEPRYEYDDKWQQVAITFVIKARKRAVYDEPVISGDTSVLTKEDIVRATRWRRLFLPGYRGITATRTRSGIDHITLKYEDASHVLATVVLADVAPEPDRNRGKPEITVNPGPVVDITVVGTKISTKVLRENVPVFEEHAIDPDLLLEGTNDLRDYFQAQGYFDVMVTFTQRQVDRNGTAIVYRVERGARHRLAFLAVAGNKYFDAETIRERMLVAPKSFELRRGRYSEAFLRRDIETIKALYESNGFRDDRVTSRVVDDYRGRPGDLALFLTISEGPQYIVSSLDVRGAKKLDLTRTIKSLSSQPDQPFSEFNVASDRETILGQYGQHGFAHTTFEWDSKPGPAPHTVDLEFTIDEGEQQFVRDVVISGLQTTRPSLVDKQLELGPGSPLSPAAMEDTQRKLDDLGIFAEVNVAIQNPDGEEDRKYVLYDLTEAAKYSITTGAGIEFGRIGGSNAAANLSDPGGGTGVSPRVTLDMTRLNLFGLGQSVSLQGRLSTLQKRALMNYFVPGIFDRKVFDATFSVLYDDTHDVRTFEAKREEAAAQLAQHVSKPITIFYRLTYRRVGVSNLKIDPALLPHLLQSVRVGLASFNLVQDRRDDPIDPHKGIYNTIDVGLAAKAFGSQTSFARILGRNATYYKLGDKIVLARETQIGIQPAFAIPANSDPADPIPLAERFYGGGGNTQRGFPENQAGPRDLLTGFPLGGSALFFNNTELRFPLFSSNIGGVLFEDAGNVYSSLSKISFRADQRDPADFDYMVHAAGFGLRYRTPVGPLRLDLAYSINPPKFNGFPGNYNQLVECSTAGTCQASPQQISHFQFFFSIGQAF